MKKHFMLAAALIYAPLWASAAPSIPKVFQGHWEPAQTTCTHLAKNGDALSDMGIFISEKEISYYESSCELKNTGVSTATSFQGRFLCGSAEEEWKRNISMSLKNNQLTINTDETPLVKCNK